jgi:biopolymer transport protein ExbD
MGMTAGAATKSINVTPLIDILLVLLIIFLVLMPTMLRQETVALPPHEPDNGPPDPPIVLVLHADLSVSVDGGAQVPVATIPSTLAPQLGRKPRTVFVDADGGVPWAEVVGLVDRIRGVAGDRSDAVAFQIHVATPD